MQDFKITPLERLKIISHLDFDKRILPLRLTTKHLELIEFIDTQNRGVVCASRGFAKSSIAHNIYNPTHAILSQIDECIIVVMNSHEKAKEWLKNTREIIDRAIMAGFRIERGSWGADSFELKNEFGKVVSFGASSPKRDIRGTNKNFSRPTRVLCDDLESAAPNAQINALSASGREKLNGYFFADLLPSLADSAKLTVIGTILHKEGLINKLLHDPTFAKFVAPAIVDGKSIWREKMPLTREDAEKIRALNPKRKDIESLEEIKERLIANGREDDFYREYLCLPMSEDSKIFKKEYIKTFDCVVYGEDIQTIKIRDALDTQTIIIRDVIGIKVDGEVIPRSKLDVFLCIDNASSGYDATAMTIGAKYNDCLYICDISGGVKWSPFKKCCELLRLIIEWRTSFGTEKGGVQNEYFYIYKEFIAKYREEFLKRNFYPQMTELTHAGKAKNIRIAQLEPFMRMGKFFINKQCDKTPMVIMQFMDFDINADNTDDYIDSIAYFLQHFGFVSFKQKKETFLNNNILMRGF